MRICILSIFLLLLFTTNLSSQTANIRIAHYGLEDGIAHRLVTRIEKDTNDFVWLGTPNGLNRFDGYEFLAFSTQTEGKGQLSDNSIKELTLNQQGNLVLTYKGNFQSLDIFNPTSFEVTNIPLTKANGMPGQVVDIFTQKKEGTYFLWQQEQQYYIATLTAANHIKIVCQLFKTTHHKEEGIRLIKRRNGTFFLFNGHSGITKINKQEEVAIEVAEVIFTKDELLHCTYLKEDLSGRLWLSIAEYPSVFLYDEVEGYFKKFPTPLGEVSISRLWEDDQGNLLFAHTNNPIFPGIISLSLLDKQGKWDNFSFLKEVGKYIIDVESVDFYKTTLITTDIGFKIVKNNNSTIKTFLNGLSANGSRNRIMRGITSDGNQKVFIAQEKGNWYDLDLLTDQITKRDIINKQTGKKIPINCSMQLHYDTITNSLWGITCDQDFDGSWLLKVNPTTWEAERYRFEKKIRAFTVRKDGTFWLACANNVSDAELFSFNPKIGKKKPYRTKEGQNPIKNAYPNTLTQSRTGNLLIGTAKGLFAVNIQTNSVDKYDIETGLSSNGVYAALEINEDSILIGTSKGLNIFNPKTEKNTLAWKKDGLSGEEIYGIIEGTESGTYWISTILGLTYFDVKNYTFKRFYQQDGLTHNEFNRFSHFKDKNGRYYFGGVNGLNAFFPDDLLKLEPAPSVQLTKVAYFDAKVNETVTIQTNLSSFNKIILKPNDKYLEFSFSLPDYSNPPANQFKAILLGADQDWKRLHQPNKILYNTLPAGNYQLLVKGAGSKGNWSEEALKIDIIKLQAFHRTWQFWLLCTILVGIVIQAFNEYQLKQKLKVEKIRTKLSSDLHDEVSGLLAGIAMQSELLEMGTTDEKNKDKLAKIAKTSRSAMSRMGDVLWSIDSRKDTVKDLISRMSEHTMDILNPLDIAWEMEITKINQNKKIPVLIRENLYFIFKEAINNIGKHSNATQVNIKMGNEKSLFVLIISNDGIRKKITNQSNKTGQGWMNMKMRAEKIGATWYQKQEQGFEVTLTMKKFA